MTANADRLDLLSTFVRIVDAGNLSAAAQQTGATQPTISRRLQLLEQMLGVRLLHRSTHAMTLTEDGERCYEGAKSLLNSWNTFESEVKGATEMAEGTLKVVVPHAFGQQQLVDPLAEYLRRNSNVAVEWLLHDGVPDFVASGIDCAIHVGPLQDESLVAVKLTEVPRIVVAAPAMCEGAALPQHPEALATVPWLALRTFYRNEITLSHPLEGRHTVQIRPRMSTDSVFALRSAALKGLGACVISAWVVQENVARGTLLHLAPSWRASALPVHLVYPYAHFYPAKLRRFVAVVREALPADMSRLPDV